MKKDLYIILLEKEAANELSTAEKTDLQNWLTASAENAETARVYRQILKSSGNYSKLVEIDLDARFAELESKIDAPAPKVREMKSGLNWMRIAATFALLIGAFYVYQNFAQPAELQWAEVEIARGDSEVFTFSDGSKMTLRGGSKIEYPEAFLGKERRVKLSGEAFFEVEKDPTQPFIVELENGEVRVLGTSFNIDSKTNSENVTVFVKTGTVQFSAKAATQNTEVILTKNETGIFNRKENSLKEVVAKNANEISWMTRKFEFKNQPIGEVLSSFPDIYGKSITLENKELASCPIDISFENESIEVIAESIAAVFGMEMTRVSAMEYLLKGGSCN